MGFRSRKAGGGEPRKRQPLDEQALFEYATASLGRRAQSVAELKRKLRTRVEEGEAGEQKIAAVVAKLKEYRFLNDQAFAENYTRLRQENEKLGRRRVQQGLMQKGVHPEVATRALEGAYEGVSEESLAREYIARKRLREPKDKKEAARLMRRLAAAGFAPPAIFAVLRRWIPEEQALPDLDDINASEE